MDCRVNGQELLPDQQIWKEKLKLTIEAAMRIASFSAGAKTRDS